MSGRQRRTTATGQWAWCRAAWLTEPSRRPPNPPRPRLRHAPRGAQLPPTRRPAARRRAEALRHTDQRFVAERPQRQVGRLPRRDDVLRCGQDPGVEEAQVPVVHRSVGLRSAPRWPIHSRRPGRGSSCHAVSHGDGARSGAMTPPTPRDRKGRGRRFSRRRPRPVVRSRKGAVARSRSPSPVFLHISPFRVLPTASLLHRGPGRAGGPGHRGHRSDTDGRTFRSPCPVARFRCRPGTDPRCVHTDTAGLSTRR